MGMDDKAKHKGEDAKGRAKEAAGAASGNDDLKREGRDDQTKASAKSAGDKAKDAAQDAKKAMKR